MQFDLPVHFTITHHILQTSQQRTQVQSPVLERGKKMKRPCGVLLGRENSANSNGRQQKA